MPLAAVTSVKRSTGAPSTVDRSLRKRRPFNGSACAATATRTMFDTLLLRSLSLCYTTSADYRSIAGFSESAVLPEECAMKRSSFILLLALTLVLSV